MFDDGPAHDLDFHHSMLMDQRRTQTFLDAILRSVRSGDVVLDIGTGTGVLAFFCCLAGAHRVYAVEQGQIMAVAQDIAVLNGFSERIVFVPGWAKDVELPEPVDVIVTETIGNAAFDEGIVAAVADARDRFLRPGGRIIPQTVSLVGALVEHRDIHDSVLGWSGEFYSLSFDALRRIAVNNPTSVDLEEGSLLTGAIELERVDLASARGGRIEIEAHVEALRDGAAHGLACWFDATIAEGLELTNAPPNRVPSWQQWILPFDSPVAVVEGSSLAVRLDVDARGETWEWAVSLDGVRAPSRDQWQSTQRGGWTL